MFQNSVRQGDCKPELRKIEKNTIDLIYLDPPFFSQKQQFLKTRDNQKEYVFEDHWENIDSYKKYVLERLLECKPLLKDTGSIFLHCDRSASHHLRVAMDEVFGAENFQSEIIWAYKRWSNAKKGLLNAHQSIYFYSKTSDFKFKHFYENYSATTNIDQIFQKRMRDENGKTKYKPNDSGSYELINEKKGVPLSDVWEIPYLNPKAKERVGYPTQKPILLLEKIIGLVTDEQDIVLDPFCGSGTTLVAAKLLNRKFIGIDISTDAVELALSRLKNPIKSESNLLKNGESNYLNQDPEILHILTLIDATPVQRNRGIDGFLKINNLTKPIPVKIQRENESVQEATKLLIQASSKNGFQIKILIKTHNHNDNLLFNFSTTEISENLIIANGFEDFITNRDRLLTIA
jgi:site-specific DNA-methyltransferase (adenine-specific)